MIMLLIVALVLLIPTALLVGLCWWLWKKGPHGRCGAIMTVCVVCGVLCVAYFREQASNERVAALRASLDAGLRKALSVGDGPEKIEAVLKGEKLAFQYSDILDGYYASMPTERPDSRIDITIAVDKSKRVQAISVKTFYTSL